MYRDWKGLADLTGCNREDVSSINCSPDPTFNVLKRWSENEGSTVKVFLLFLQQMDRYDVFDDIISLVSKLVIHNCIISTLSYLDFSKRY